MLEMIIIRVSLQALSGVLMSGLSNIDTEQAVNNIMLGSWTTIENMLCT